MKIIFCCQSVDTKDPVTGDTLDRINGLIKNGEYEHVFVLTSRGALPASSEKVSFYTLARQNNSRLRSFFIFIRTLQSILKSHQISFFYAYMVPTLAFLLFPFSVRYKVPIYVWFAHSRFTFPVRFSLNYLVKKWVTVDAGQSFKSRSPRYIIGQGVDTSVFKKITLDKDKIYDLITIGRITKVKNLELIFHAIHQLKLNQGKELSLSLCGETYSPEDQEYKNSLILLAEQLGISKLVHFQGLIGRNELPQFINQARVFVFTVPGGIGKASLEAFACGLPSIISSPEAKDFFPIDLANKILCERNVNSITQKMHELFEMSSDQRDQLGQEIMLFTQKFCSLDSFSQRLNMAFQDQTIRKFQTLNLFKNHVRTIK